MKKYYGNLMNRLMENNNYVEPVAGMDVTECHYSDRSAWKIIEVDNDKKGFTMQRYAAKNKGGIGSQEWIYDNEDGTPRLSNQKVYVRYKYKKWKINGVHDISLIFNRRDEYYDWSF